MYFVPNKIDLEVAQGEVEWLALSETGRRMELSISDSTGVVKEAKFKFEGLPSGDYLVRYGGLTRQTQISDSFKLSLPIGDAKLIDCLLYTSQRSNVYCKVSGMVTEAKWDSWTAEELTPYFETVFEAFTPRRTMFGSDWPVITLASKYCSWVELVKRVICKFSPDEQERVLAGTAVELSLIHI